MLKAAPYNLVATCYRINLNKLIDQHGKEAVVKMLQEMTPEEIDLLEADPYYQLRTKQVVDHDGEYFGCLNLCARGFGKSHQGSVFTGERAYLGYSNIALIGQNSHDVVHKQVMDGKSSIIELYKNTAFCPTYNKTDRKLTFPNGAFAITYAGDEEGQIRGVSGTTAWMDELAKFQYAETLVGNLEFAIRESSNPFVLITTTPIARPAIVELAENPMYIQIRGTTMENANHPEKYLANLASKDPTSVEYRQEILGELIADKELALWNRVHIDPYRVETAPTNYENIVIAVDPTTGHGKKRNDEAGIVVACSAYVGDKMHAYIMEDASVKGSPDVWAKKVKEMQDKYPLASIVAEDNQGGAMVTEVLTKYGVDEWKIQLKKHINSKYDRATPIAALAQKGYIHHCGYFKELEDECCSYTGDPKEKSPNRLDAKVMAVHALLIAPRGRMTMTRMPF